MKQGIERNISLFYIVRALFMPFFWLPVLYFYLTQVKGFSVPQTALLLSLQELLLIFLELPTGVVADKISRKFSVTLGYLITSLPFAILPFVSNFGVVIGLFAIKAVGKALVSGADSALLYDSLVDLDRTSEYKKIMTKAGAWAMGVASVTMFLGGYLGEQQLYNWTLWLPLPLQIVGALAAWLMIEPEVSRKAKDLQQSNYLRHVWDAAKMVVTNKQVLLLAIVFAVLEGTAVNLKWYYPPIFAQFSFGLLLTGMVMSLLYLGRTLTGIIGKYLIVDNPLVNSRVWIRNVMFAWLFMSLVFQWWVIIPGLFTVIMAVEFATNSTEEMIHQALESKVRATAMSFVNLLSSVGATLLLWSWGGMISFGGVVSAMWLQVVVFAAIAGIVFVKIHHE